LRREIIGDAALLLGRGRVDQPHQQEKRHHRGDEIGVRNLPGAAMVGMAAGFLDPLDDDGAFAGHFDTHRIAAARFA
jgi:hypothetical protein